MKPLSLLSWLSLVLCLLSVSCSTNASAQSSSETTAYIENKGSDTIVNLALAWAEYLYRLRKEYRQALEALEGLGDRVEGNVYGPVDQGCDSSPGPTTGHRDTDVRVF